MNLVDSKQSRRTKPAQQTKLENAKGIIKHKWNLVIQILGNEIIHEQKFDFYTLSPKKTKL